jgi:hypothetical protein
MNTIFLRCYWILLAVLVGLGAGCKSIDSVGSSVKERFGGMPPRVRTVNGDEHKVYDAVRQVMEKFGYRVTGGGPAQGRLEGLTRIEGDDSFGSSRQRGIAIRLAGLEGDRVELQVRMTEIVEEGGSRSAQSATETPLRDPAAYEAFFKEVERRLEPSAPGRSRP